MEARSSASIQETRRGLPSSPSPSGEPCLQARPRGADSPTPGRQAWPADVNLISERHAWWIARAREASERRGLGAAQVSVEAPGRGAPRRADPGRRAPSAADRSEASRLLRGRPASTCRSSTTVNARNADAALGRCPSVPRAAWEIRRFATDLFVPERSAATRKRRAASASLPPHPRSSRRPLSRRGARKPSRQRPDLLLVLAARPSATYNPVARSLGNKSCAAMDGPALRDARPGRCIPCSCCAEPMGGLLSRGLSGTSGSRERASRPHTSSKRFARRR